MAVTVTVADIKKLRDKTSAGMMDCKRALEEAEGDFEKAVEILRKKGQAIAAKRSDREASEGCVLAKADGNFAAVVALKCETDFVAKNADTIALTRTILDAAIANRPADLAALLALQIEGRSVKDLVTERSGVTGEKMELSDYVFVEGASTNAYIHAGNRLATVVAFAEENANTEAIHGVAMQVAAMNPLAIDENGIAQEVKDREMNIAIEKTKQDEVNKAVENAIRKAGINPNLTDSDDHIESNMAKGWLTPEQAEQARQLRASVPAEAEAALNMKKVEMIAQGRVAKFFKENTLVAQVYVMSEDKQTVGDFMKKNGLTCTDFRRVTLNQE
jgi:elongation factor Ts